jgi:hypothetical protein
VILAAGRHLRRRGRVRAVYGHVVAAPLRRGRPMQEDDVQDGVRARVQVRDVARVGRAADGDAAHAGTGLLLDVAAEHVGVPCVAAAAAFWKLVARRRGLCREVVRGSRTAESGNKAGVDARSLPMPTS